MSVHEPELHPCKNHPPAAGRRELSGWVLCAAAFAAAVILLPASPSRAQTPAATTTAQVKCLPSQQPLPQIPELVSNGSHILHATMTVISEYDRVGTRYPVKNAAGGSTQPGDPASFPGCFPQWVRAFRSPDAVPPYAGPIAGADYGDVMPGPTLRARVGDIIELTFLNNVNPTVFGKSIDLGDTSTCDSSAAVGNNGHSLYPGSGVGHDTYPNCFHGSTTANLHFHGTHTNPNSTGDNVFLEILSSLRQTGKPVVTPESVKPAFDAFFQKCEVELGKGSHVEWPRQWSDFPTTTWTDDQKTRIMNFDKQPGAGKPLWPVNQAQLDMHAWPQYYIGSYPYCFRLPDYPGVPPQAAGHAGMNMGGAAEKDGSSASTILNDSVSDVPLQMGQAPGTHWYHAHKHGSTTIDINNGMVGAFIIEGLYDDEINDAYKAYGPMFTRKVPVMVINQFGTSPNLMGPGTNGQDKGPDFSVNGRTNPVVTMRRGEVQMWRIVNTSARAGVYFIGPPAGFHWRQLAQDGVQFKDVNYKASQDRSFLLAAGNRADLLVKAPDSCTSPCTASIQVYNEVNPGDITPPSTPFKNNLITVRINATDPPYSPPMDFMASAPTFPPFLGDITDDQVKGTQTITFETVPQQFSTGKGPPTDPAAIHTINGVPFDGKVGVTVLLNKVEQWKITNNTTFISHPFHIHINPFQVVEVFRPNDVMPSASGSGTVATTSGSANIVGTGTAFLSQLRINDVVIVTGQTAKVKAIADDTHLTLASNASVTSQGLSYSFLAPRYVTDNTNIRAGQCYLDPKAAKPDDAWKPCNGTGPSAKDQIWWDVFPIPSGLGATDAAGNPINNASGAQIIIPGYFKMRSRFVDYAGYFVIHCHILAHEDRGMMTVVEVTPSLPPFSHH
ncbi:MAG TPA: multicopper oxidase domain-containing protein [Thermoanaerobaculia bacterium]|nr:multicopper oxidase domain-containing protein [Thermoanaerobaculia bacterium]